MSSDGGGAPGGENLFTNVEKQLKKNINIILSEETNTDTDDSLENAVKSFEESVRKLQNYFTKCSLTFSHLSPAKAEQDEMELMKEELSRKDALIKDQMKKLSRYRMELEVIQEAQMQARSKTF